MAREVKGQVGCSLKACVAAILSIVTSIIVVIVVVNLLNTGAENENENVAGASPSVVAEMFAMARKHWEKP
mgnify:CR=1 FL=1